MANSNDNLFEVRFSGLELTDAQRESISSAIRKAAMLEIAKMEFRDEITIHSPTGRGPLDGLEAVFKPLRK
ncbi:hypothetical protein [Paracoccus benzoatiresistens]|uniref:Uncharacterized protein n=1 Tax=Paracoccus benzoatiresistens TaxID=2997341 RepID=A0ABT4J9X0_9RHOB|nr:hypothetical protein [Paracoccus sp. EF6]MCZ0963500.1 hypothetical protein [Paracoccus sp. EF6]